MPLDCETVIRAKTCIEGSNPSLSARFAKSRIHNHLPCGSFTLHAPSRSPRGAYCCIFEKSFKLLHRPSDFSVRCLEVAALGNRDASMPQDSLNYLVWCAKFPLC